MIHARSGGDRGLFIGDVLHHPLQCLKPEWSTFACTDMDGSRVSRTRLLDEHADSGTLVMPAHFPEPTAGWVRRHGPPIASISATEAKDVPCPGPRTAPMDWLTGEEGRP